ncbi:hypothetical protein KVR01_006203 [Diaporthe batatas]|uniref:uncharacterized protein n=1 Tax=Diaporthe batatas TaxID=748121 RepID=UPI001D04B4AD|nr:uncharacterized protein KVR01_006203 [Diaporthe batatas]KAG8164285.1 hypothetical protein KVR01_006203 [Diaporthe batatas]
MRNIITILLIAMAAFLGLVNAGLIDAGDLNTHNTPKLQNNTSGSNQTVSNVSESRTSCYSAGTEWADLGNWQDVFNALQVSGVMRVHSIPAGYHIPDNVPVGPHCYVYEVGITKGHAYPSKVDYNKGLEMVYTCTRGGKKNVNFVDPNGDGEIIAKGWVKGDPQRNKDCSGQ